MPKHDFRNAHTAGDRLRSVLSDPLNLIPIGLALLWLAVALFGRPLGDYGVETDFYGDVRYAREWFSGMPSLMNGYRGPGYHLILGALGWVFRDFFLAGKLLSVAAAALGLRILGALLESLWGRRAALLGMLFVAATPTFIHYTFRACTDTWFWLLFVGALALFFHDDARPVRRWTLAGVLSGTAWLTRYNGGVLVPIAIVSAALLVRPWKRAAGAALGFLAATLVVASPWMAYVWHETGNPFWNNTYQLVAANVYGGDPSMAEQGRLKNFVGFESLDEVLAVDPGRVATRILADIPEHLGSDVTRLVGIPLAVLAVLGFGLGWTSWRGRRALAFALAGVLTFAGLVPAFYNARFMLPLLVWWAAAAGGLGRLAVPPPVAAPAPGPAKGKRRRPKPASRTGRKAAAAATLLVLAGMVVFQNQAVIRRAVAPAGNESPPREILELAKRIRQAGIPVGPDTPIAARKPQIGYCLNAPVVGIPYGTLEDLFRSGARYFLVSGAEINAFPNLQAFVAHTDQPPPGLEYLVSYRAQVRGSFLFAAFYKVTESLPAVAAQESTPQQPDYPGLGRIDELRARLARWILIWEPERPVRGLLDRITASGQTQLDVLLLRGDTAWMQQDAAATERYYTEAVSRYPQAVRARYRLAGLRLLTAKGSLRPRDVLGQEALPAEAAGDTAAWWKDQATAMQVSGDFAAAVAPCLACLDYDPRRVTCYRSLGDALSGTGHLEDALNAYLAYSRAVPDDRAAIDLIRTLRQALARKGG